MIQCGRCGTVNGDGALSCAACGAVLVSDEVLSDDVEVYAPPPAVEPDAAPATASMLEATVPMVETAASPPLPPPKVNPYAELATLGATPPARGSEAAEAAAEVRLRRPAPIETVPDWIVPPPLDAKPVARPEPPSAGRRMLVLVPMLIAWIAIFYVVPAWAIWSTSPELRQAQRTSSLVDYFRSLPSCAESAGESGQPANICSDPAVKASYNTAVSRIRSERRRVEAFIGITAAAAALTFLILLMATGLSLWWWFAILVSPLSLIVEIWAMWRLSAYPVRYWEG